MTRLKPVRPSLALAGLVSVLLLFMVFRISDLQFEGTGLSVDNSALQEERNTKDQAMDETAEQIVDPEESVAVAIRTAMSRGQSGKQARKGIPRQR